MCSRPEQRAHARRRPGVALVVIVVAGSLYVLLTLMVAGHVTDPLDRAARDVFRPDGVWGPAQLRADVIVRLRPLYVVVLLAVVAAGSAVVQRSWRPVVVAAVAATSTGAVVGLTKILLARPDPNLQIATVGGAYPSGHTAMLLATVGGGVLALVARPVWWSWVSPVLLDVVMGACLLVQATHWLTDVVGGVLVACCGLALAAWVSRRWTRRSAATSERRARRPAPDRGSGARDRRGAAPSSARR